MSGMPSSGLRSSIGSLTTDELAQVHPAQRFEAGQSAAVRSSESIGKPRNGSRLPIAGR